MRQMLLIEDDEVFARVLQTSMSHKGIEVKHLSSLSKLLTLTESHFDYIVLDLFLANESGLDALTPLRNSYPKAKILILTGYASIATTVQAIKAGADNYLPKPANASQILQALEANFDYSSHQDRLEREVLSVEQMQWEHIQKVLTENGGNISATARALGMHRRTLQRRLYKKPKNNK